VFNLFQPFQAVGGSLASAGHQVGSLVAATGHLMASVGTRTCALRRGRRVRPEDREDADNAVATSSASRAEDGLDQVVAHPAEVIPAVEPVPGPVVGASTVPPSVVDEVIQDAEPSEDSVVVMEPEPQAEVIPIVVNLDDSFVSLPPAPSSTASFRSAQSSVSSTASISTLMRAMPTRKFMIRSALELESDESGSDESSDTSKED
jgi:hypothetical protein